MIDVPCQTLLDKKSGIALGTLIPFGIGVAVGASFNYFTMERFSKTTLKYVTNTSDPTNNKKEMIMRDKKEGRKSKSLQC